jgi:hypothetical protein
MSETRRFGTALKFLSLAGLGVYLLLCTREYAAMHFAAQNTDASLSRAARLEPRSAEIWSHIGRRQLFAQGDTAAAAKTFRRSLALDPYDSSTWLDLAAAEEISGSADQAHQAMLRAIAVDRTTPSIHWRAATYFLSHGDDTSALHEIKIAAEHSKALIPDAIHAVWNITRNANIVFENLPQTQFAYSEALSYFVRGQQPEAAGVAWQRLQQLGEPIDVETMAPYAELLIVTNHVDQAVEVWTRYCAGHAQSSYCDERNTLRNGSFEEPALSQGFDWHFLDAPGVEAATDFSTAYEGSRSLRIDYSDSAQAEAGVYQLIPLHRNSTYRFSGVYKPDGLSALHPPQLVLDDPQTQQVLATSPQLSGTSAWQSFSVTFSSGDVPLARVRVLHRPVEGPIHGTVWLDALRLESQ